MANDSTSSKTIVNLVMAFLLGALLTLILSYATVGAKVAGHEIQITQIKEDLSATRRDQTATLNLIAELVRKLPEPK